jgi:hypothetical protein
MLWIEQLKFELHTVLRLLFVFMGKPSFQFVFGNESKWQKHVVFGHFKNTQEPAVFMKQSMILWLIISLF